MNGPESLLHVVCRDKIAHASKFVQKSVFEAIHWCGSNDGGLREYTANDILALRLEMAG